MRAVRITSVAALATAALISGAGIAMAAPSVTATVLSDGSVAVSATGCGTSGATASVMWGSNQGQSVSKTMQQSSGPLVATFTGLRPGRYTVQVNCNNSAAPDPGVAMITIKGKPRGGARAGDGATQASTTDELAFGSALALGGVALGGAALRRRRNNDAA